MKKKNANEPIQNKAKELFEALINTILPESGISFSGSDLSSCGGIEMTDYEIIARSSPSLDHPCFIGIAAYHDGSFNYALCFNTDGAWITQECFRAGFDQELQNAYRMNITLSQEECACADPNKIARKLVRRYNEYTALRLRAMRFADKMEKKARRWTDINADIIR